MARRDEYVFCKLRAYAQSMSNIDSFRHPPTQICKYLHYDENQGNLVQVATLQSAMAAPNGKS